MALSELKSLFEGAQCQGLDLPILQPADPYLNTAGEAFRKRLFVTQSSKGETLCLRPEFTIPVCRHHLAEGRASQRYSYQGSVFRQRVFDDLRPAEFPQAGVESFGEADFAKADAEMVLLALQAVRLNPSVKPEILMGDPDFFNTFVKPVDLSDIWRQRLVRAFGDDRLLDGVLKRMVAEADNSDGLLPEKFSKLVEAGDREGLIEALEDEMIDHGMINVGGRSPQDVAERALAKYAERTKVDTHIAELCRSFLKIECDAAEVGNTMTAFAEKTDANLTAPVETFEKRFASGLNKVDCPIRFSASFGRRLDYYTGFVFEIYDANDRDKGPVAGGGRYDKLTEVLGGKPSPAVGFSLWLDRLFSDRENGDV